MRGTTFHVLTRKRVLQVVIIVTGVPGCVVLNHVGPTEGNMCACGMYVRTVVVTIVSRITR